MGKFVFNKNTGVMELVNSVDVSTNNEVRDDVSIGAVAPSIKKSNTDIEINEGIVQFREISDKTIYEICDKDTGKTLGYISGYALDMSFKTNELNSTAKIEQFLNGLKSLFRNLLMENLLNK